MAENRQILMIDMHHIISDGFSMGILTREFMAVYGGEQLSPLRLQYKDFSLWQNSKKGKETIKEQEHYWLTLFQTKVPELKLPYDYPRPGRRDFAGAACAVDIPAEDTHALKKLAKQEEVTLFMVLTAVYNILLSNLGWKEDLVIGTPVSGREQAELRQTIGMFVNTLALRNFPHGEKTFTGFLKEIKENTLQAFENQLYPFEDLVEKIQPDRDISHNPLFDTMFVLQNIDIPVLEIPGLQMKPYEYKMPISKFDLTLTAVEKEHTLELAFEYSTQLFKEEKIKRFLEYFKEILHTAAANPHIKLNEIQLPTGLSDLEQSASPYEEIDGDLGF